MIAVVSVEQRFQRTPDGRVWTQVAFSHRFWQRYLEAFDGVRVVARVRDVTVVPPQYIRADGPGVTVAAVPDYLGPMQYLRKARAVRRALTDVVDPGDAVILRVPSHLANCMFVDLLRRSHPYAVEVVGDPWDVFAPGVVEHPLRPFFRWHFTRQLRRQCLGACGAAYVTEWTLQQRYHTAANSFSTFYSSVQLPSRCHDVMHVGVSDVELSDGCFRPRQFRIQSPATPLRLVMVGSLAQLYKGPDVALRALAICVRGGWNMFLTIVGEGKFRSSLEQQAKQLGLSERVVFRGQLPQGAAVQAELDRADLFIMPSQTEGLPRAMLEAMARGLPCIGSAVGGIPELLPPEDLFPPGDLVALAQKLQEVLADPARMQRMATRNLKRAGDYREATLRERRLAFYCFVREQTEAWGRVRSTSLPNATVSTVPFTQLFPGERRKSA
jgi:glycosyltransferase involved in cell wall biosynthesis